MRRVRWRRWNGKWSDVNGGERRDVVRDLDGVRSVDGVKGDGVEALRMGGTSGEAVLSPIGW